MVDSHNETPSTDWSEVIFADETARHEKFAADIVAIQSRLDAKYGAGRAFHRKAVGAARARVRILDNLPDFARHGLFGTPGAYEAVIRLSNGALIPQNNALPDVRGFALSVRGVEGPGALGGRTDRQDFVLINRPNFGFRTSEEFAELVPITMQGQAAVAKFFIAKYGPVQGAVAGAKLTKDFAKPFSGFATTNFHSAAPIRVGPYAAKVRLTPQHVRRRLTSILDAASDIRGRLAEADLHYELQLQFFINDDDTPIEDASVTWSEKSTFVPVAKVTLPRQDLDSQTGKGFAEAIEDDAFDPWAALADHQPLGEIMRARKVAYFASVTQRRKDADG
jgi:hypothetical protein